MDLDEVYLQTLREEFPRLRLVNKADDRLSKIIDRALRIVTLGGQRRYLDAYVTTLGQGIYLPAHWSARSPTSRYLTLRHEAVHLRQFRRYGFVLMALLYLIPFVPLGLAWGRARLEWEAYRETLIATAEVCGISAARDPGLRESIVTQFTGPAYGWMWPFRSQVESWIDRLLSELEP